MKQHSRLRFATHSNHVPCVAHRGKVVVLDELIGGRFSVVALLMAMAVTGGLVLLEFLVPSPVVVYSKQHAATPFFLNAVAIHPVICGVALGALQMLLFTTQKRGLGSSTSYVMTLALLLRCKNDYLTKTRNATANVLQMTFVVFAILGSFISCSLSSSCGLQHGLPPLRSIAGGFFLLFGARMANGCTSGHGLTGNALLWLNSFVATAGMFGGGIAFAMVCRHGLHLI
jgi:hypothetical protein